jgi:hypothetical protein
LTSGSSGARTAGAVLEVRVEPYLKRFVVRCDDGRLCYASECELALEGDPGEAPLGPSLHEE